MNLDAYRVDPWWWIWRKSWKKIFFQTKFTLFPMGASPGMGHSKLLKHAWASNLLVEKMDIEISLGGICDHSIGGQCSKRKSLFDLKRCANVVWHICWRHQPTPWRWYVGSLLRTLQSDFSVFEATITQMGLGEACNFPQNVLVNDRQSEMLCSSNLL